MTYEQMMERLGELEAEAQAADDAGETVSAEHRAEVAALETAIEATPEYEALIEKLST
jgi:hypothetical protein